MCIFLGSMSLYVSLQASGTIMVLEQQATKHPWQCGTLDYSAPEESIATNWQTYGIDYDGPLTDIETDNNVVPESHIQLTDHQLQELQNRIDPLSDDGNNGIKHFLDTVTIMEGFTEQ